MYAYAYPPICLIPKILQYMRQFHCQIILIAPQWPMRHWYADLLQFLIAYPIRFTKAAKSTKNKQLSSKSTSIQFDCLASINRSFQAKGFSQQARSLLSASWRKGTQRDYGSKFKKYCSWCCTRKINPNSATLNQVVDFFVRSV